MLFKKSFTERAMCTVSNHPIATIGGVGMVGATGYLLYNNRKLDARVAALEAQLKATAPAQPEQTQASA